MFKRIIFFACLCVAAFDTAHAQKHIRIDEKSEQRSVCGLFVGRQPGLVINASRISESSLHNRIDNERYNACPYWVTLKYQAQTMRLDFSSPSTLQDIRNFDASSTIMDSGFFTYDGTTWQGDSNVFDNDKSQISTHESPDSMLVIGNMLRKLDSKKFDYCINILVIGNERSAGGGVCAANKSTLAPLLKLFKNESVLSFEK
jgi:hypothetical protein